MNNKRRTKIVATVGPASSSEGVLFELILAGVDIFRFNLKHGTVLEHGEYIDRVRKVAKEVGRAVEVLIDIPSSTFSSGIDLGIDKKSEFIAVSYIKKVEELREVKAQVAKSEANCKVLAKIETKEALLVFDDILAEVDLLMVARGDLGRSILLEKVPFAQKEIIMATEKVGKKVIVATEMLLSMVDSEIPTRAEASDVANAVLDGSNAVMLSEETAIGKYPVDAVATMARVIVEAESWQKLEHLHISSGENRIFQFG